jgi:16S rRNA (guanine527-N7)-methyltransferase
MIQEPLKSLILSIIKASRAILQYQCTPITHGDTIQATNSTNIFSNLQKNLPSHEMFSKMLTSLLRPTHTALTLSTKHLTHTNRKFHTHLPLRALSYKYIDASPRQQQSLDAYVDVLLEWNSVMNLTAVTDRSEVYDRHINDSMSLIPLIDSCLQRQQQQQQQQQQQGNSNSNSTIRMIDVGSGAGLPGLILAILHPEWDITLLDSLQKRCRFLEAAVDAINVQNVSIVCARAEDAGQDILYHRQQYDIVVARAVAELRVLAELCLPLTRPGGHWIAAKGSDPCVEVEEAGPAVKMLGGKLVGVEEVDSEVSPGGQKRTAVIVQKVGNTSPKYPRRPGVPKKIPL